MFNLNVVSAAFAAQGEAESSFDALKAEMMVWNFAGEYPAPKDVQVAIKEGLPHLGPASVKVYASRVLQWSKAGKTPRSIHHMCTKSPNEVSSGRGRPKGKGKGKTTKPGAPDTPTTPTTPEGSAWSAFVPTLTAIKARCAVLEFKDGTKLPSDELAQVQDALDRVIVTIMRRIK